jgi:threonine/homoserine/homoserine lactone efflux protein
VTWSSFGSFLLIVTVLTLVPGADFAVTVKNTLVGGRRQGRWAAAGISTACAVQGTVAVLGLGALIVRAEGVFAVIKWAGVAYLALLGVQAVRSAIRADFRVLEGGPARPTRRTAWTGFGQGLLSNITNPKVLVFYLAVMPQFLTPDAGAALMTALALSHAVIGCTYLFVLVSMLDRMRHILARRRVRRSLEAATGVVLLGFSASLAIEA